jgi:L-fuconolactonase
VIDFPLVDSHVHLLQPKRLRYGWTKDAPTLDREVLPGRPDRNAHPIQIEQFVFVEVDVDFPSTSTKRPGWPRRRAPSRA